MHELPPVQPAPPAAPPKSRLKSAWHYLTKTKDGRIFSLALIAIIVVGLGLVFIISRAYIPHLVDPGVILLKKIDPVYSPLTGKELSDPIFAERPVTAVMIENSPDARPQSGLKQAGLVYEAIAEGGISRFVALYQEDRPELIGPVRSLRPYYVEWLAAYDPAVAHVGGSARSLSMIRSGNYGLDIDQFFNPVAYWRVDDRSAPHNVYTDSDHLDKLIQSKSKTGSKFTPLPRQDAPKDLPPPTAKSIKMDISSGAFAVSYDYDAKANSYLRKQGGKTHRDREKGDIKPTTVIAIKVSQHMVNEDGYRESIKTTGEGKAYIFQNGQVVEGIWHKDSAKDQIEFTDKAGETIELNRGQTWITAVAEGRGVSWQ